MAERIRLEDRECPLSATLGWSASGGPCSSCTTASTVTPASTSSKPTSVSPRVSSRAASSDSSRTDCSNACSTKRTPPRYEYVLTDLGRSLRPVIVALAAWGNARLAPTARSMVLVDSETGVEAEPILVDRSSGRRVDGPDFVFSAGPAASKPFRDRYEGRPGPSNSAGRSRESRTARILERVRAIPRGSVQTYSGIDPDAPRVVGRVLATTHEKVPWHRVVRADGSAPMGADQLALLRKERVPMRGDRVDLARALPKS